MGQSCRNDDTPNEYGIQSLNISCIQFFWKRDLESKGYGKKSTQFNENEGNIELLLFTMISVNQFSIYGSIADLYKELNEDSAEG